MYILKSNPCGSIPIFQLVHLLSVIFMAPKSKSKAVAIPECFLYVKHYYFFNIYYVLYFFVIKKSFEAKYQKMLQRNTRICTTSFPTI